MSCGGVGDIVLIRGVARRPSLVEAVDAPLDGPSVEIVDAEILGTADLQTLCKGRVPLPAKR